MCTIEDDRFPLVLRGVQGELAASEWARLEPVE